jgi:Fuc2NAc and GlcNAc transferase
MVSALLIFLLGLVAGLVLEWGVYSFVQRPHLLVRPTGRSSHTQPTPTMGGIVIVVVVLAYLAVMSSTVTPTGWPLFGALAALAVVGLWDDLSQLSARVRLVVHFAAAALVLWSLDLALPMWVQAVVLVALVWFVNLYNFMDGIDGFAAAQCLVFCLGAHWVAAGIPGWSGDVLWLLAGVSLSFLAFNWPPAKIFMGDVGSAFLGLLLGILTLYLWQTGSVPLISSLILLAVFWFDATYTLCVRILTHQEFTQAHRLHLYQHVAQKKGHLWTTLAMLFYAMLWLLPLAWVAALPERNFMEQSLALFAAVLPLLIACWRMGAGISKQEA